MKRRWDLCLRASPLLFVLCTICLSAQSIESTVTGTGAVHTQNLAFSVIGTLGQPATGQITVGERTAEQGFWYNKRLAQTSSAEPATTGIQIIEFDCFPNPVSTTASIRVHIPENNNASLTLTDLAGRTVRKILDEESLSGIRTATLSTEGLSSGKYTLILRTETGMNSLPIFVVH